MLSNPGVLRKGFAVAAIVPFTVIGLAGCASGEETLTERTREPKATTPVADGAQEQDGGGLPFPFPDGSEDDGSEGAGGSGSGATTPAPGPTGTGGSNSGGNNSSGNVVTYEDIDLSSVNWSTICSTTAGSQYVIASDQDATGDVTGATLMISSDERDKPDYLFISTGGSDSSDTLYWSDSAEGGSITMSFSGDEFTASGEAFTFNDYTYDNPISFEVKLTCDVTY